MRFRENDEMIKDVKLIDEEKYKMMIYVKTNINDQTYHNIMSIMGLRAYIGEVKDRETLFRLLF
jgi:hypothetical protein